jgi:hypothetical protein
MKHIKLFEDYTNQDTINRGDVIFIKPAEAEFTVVAVDGDMAEKISDGISLFDPNTEMPPIKLVVSDPNKNYVFYNAAKNEATLITKEEAMSMAKNNPKCMVGIEDNSGNVNWIESGDSDPDYDNPIYAVPAKMNSILFVDGWGTIEFLDGEDIEEFYKAAGEQELDPSVNLKRHSF